MDEKIEIILFEYAGLYRSVSDSAEAVCKERDISLQRIDISLPESGLVIQQYQIRSYPQCILFRGKRRIGSTTAAAHSPETFAEWIDRFLDQETGVEFHG